MCDSQDTNQLLALPSKSCLFRVAISDWFTVQGPLAGGKFEWFDHNFKFIMKYFIP